MDGAIIPIDPLPFIFANSALTLLDQQPRDDEAVAEARAALSPRAGQPGALDTRTAAHWASDAAALYNDLIVGIPTSDRGALPALPFLARYCSCLPAEILDELQLALS